MSIDIALAALAKFQGLSLTDSLSEVERTIVGLRNEEIETFCGVRGIDSGFMSSAASIKAVASQINVIIHAAGILCSLPYILSDGEVILEVSLGAGNTGKRFDLTTTNRVAEFKFIDWQGGPESIRQNSVFKDFFTLAEFGTNKKKYLYVVGTTFPMKFLQGGRALSSVLSRQPSILNFIQNKYPGVRTVRDYYNIFQDHVAICDVSPYIGRLAT